MDKVPKEMVPEGTVATEEQIATEEILRDTSFSLGYQVMTPTRNAYTHRAKIEAEHVWHDHREELQPPVWRLMQWGSNQTLANIEPRALENGGLRWQVNNDSGQVYKAVDVLPSGEVVMELNGLAEFSSDFYAEKASVNGSVYLASLDDYWPHLLFAQNLSSRKLNEYASITLSLDAQLRFDDKNERWGYRGFHAGRFPIALAVRNTLSNNTFWLMLVVYDDRFKHSSYGCRKCERSDDAEGVLSNCYYPQALDDPGVWSCPFDGKRWDRTTEKKGTRKMIFRVDTREFTTDDIHSGQWSHYEIELLPFIKAGIEAARDQGRLRGFGEALTFYDLTFFSMGWEMTGLNHSAIAIDNLRLSGELVSP